MVANQVSAQKAWKNIFLWYILTLQNTENGIGYAKNCMG